MPQWKFFPQSLLILKFNLIKLCQTLLQNFSAKCCVANAKIRTSIKDYSKYQNRLIFLVNLKGWLYYIYGTICKYNVDKNSNRISIRLLEGKSLKILENGCYLYTSR